MVVAFTAFAFIDSMENGGVGLKLGCFRAEAAKIAAKMVRESRKTEDGVRQVIILYFSSHPVLIYVFLF